MLNMRSQQAGRAGRPEADLTARASIRDAALRLFAQHGPDAVPVRRIATEAGVSAALVLHHFGSKDGLREEVAEHVAGLFEGAVETSDMPGMGEEMSRHETASARELLARTLPPGSPVPRYLGRLLMSGDPAGHRIVARWHRLTVDVLTDWQARGLIDAGEDPQWRAAILMSSDLGALLLHDHLTRLLGVDPFDEGLERWSTEAYAVYAALWPQTPSPPTSGPGES